MQNVYIKEVKSGREMDDFVRLPRRLYAGNPYYVPDLESDIRETFDPAKNAALEFSDIQAFVAYDEAGTPVGRIAGINMAGGKAVFDKAIPMNAIGFFGLHMITAGTYTGEVIDKSQGENVKKLYCKDNLLKGYIMIGDVDKAGIYTSLIRDRVALDSIDFALVSETPGLMAFSKKYRDETLGGLRRGY